jgi:PRTRC genetic system protein C
MARNCPIRTRSSIPKLGPEGVKTFYGTQFPELVNAVLEGPVLEGGVQVYRFAVRVGKNG